MYMYLCMYIYIIFTHTHRNTVYLKAKFAYILQTSSDYGKRDFPHGQFDDIGS